jgi:Zn-dependent protease
MQGSFKVGMIGGIAIRVHYTWLFAVLLIAWSLALGYFPSAGQGRGAGTDWLLAIIAALLLFGSVLVHELGHSLVARARGLRVEDITLFIFGGVSSIAQEAASAWDEFVVAVVGPLISLALAGLFWAVGQVVPPESAVSPVARYLAMANLLLGLFNIVPGFPLDDGRVLRGIVWGATGDMARDTAGLVLRPGDRLRADWLGRGERTERRPAWRVLDRVHRLVLEQWRRGLASAAGCAARAGRRAGQQRDEPVSGDRWARAQRPRLRPGLCYIVAGTIRGWGKPRVRPVHPRRRPVAQLSVLPYFTPAEQPRLAIYKVSRTAGAPASRCRSSAPGATAACLTGAVEDVVGRELAESRRPVDGVGAGSRARDPGADAPRPGRS